MDPQIGKAGFSIGVFLVVTGGLLLPFQDRSSAEFVITVITVVIGLVFMLGIALVVTISRKS